MKIEAGKFYKTHDGDKKGPMFYDDDVVDGYPFRDAGFSGWWNADGERQNRIEPETDLIAEWTDEPRPWGELTDAEKGALLLAWHEDELIEFLDADGTWKAERPNWMPHTAYRVKPEPVVETVTLTGFPDDEGGTWCFGKDSLPEDTHRITFTTKDGEPDCDSIKMERINV